MTIHAHPAQHLWVCASPGAAKRDCAQQVHFIEGCHRLPLSVIERRSHPVIGKHWNKCIGLFFRQLKTGVEPRLSFLQGIGIGNREGGGVKFRRDIQGLRALAIAPVVIFHANAALVPGGYVGVDIFFVISGYLITGILLGEIHSGTFSIAGFYARRVKRLFPGLFLMLIISLVAGLILLPPTELAMLGTATLAAIGFVANFFAHGHADYFSETGVARPLLHLWSLGVEEQFYLLFPLFLWTVGRIRLPTTRAYELLAGAILAASGIPAVRARVVRDLTSVAGLAMILAAMVLFDGGTAMPGWNALRPVVGAALIIAAGETGPSLGGRVLSWPPFVLLGSISYSLYLWHWPILVYQRWIDLGPPSPLALSAAVMLAVVVAWLSWRFVERPILARRDGTRTVLIAGAAAILGVAALAAPVILSHGIPRRFGTAALRMLGARKDINPRRDACASRTLAYADTCTFGANVPPSIAVWSDSFSVELADALGEREGARGRSVLELTNLGCPPALDYAPGRSRVCARATRAAFEQLRDDRRIGTVVLALSYDKYPAATRGQLMDGLASSARALRAAGKHIVLLDPVPGLPFDGPSALMLTVARGGDLARFGQPRASYDRATASILARLDNLATQTDAERIRPEARLCSHSWCFAYLPRVGPLYFDDHHMTQSAARYVVAP
jgi:peptidoglycan/LPS O-acetylase OafA/YrhL